MEVPPSCLGGTEGGEAPDLSADEGKLREPGLPELSRGQKTRWPTTEELSAAV